MTVAVGASIGWPGLRAEIQVGPSMRKLNAGAEQIGRYANRNISAFVGVNPMQFDEFSGKFYLGKDQQYYLDLSDAGVFAQWSYDGGFEEYVQSTNNLALLARWATYYLAFRSATVWDFSPGRRPAVVIGQWKT